MNSNRTALVHAPSRLHFGLLSFGSSDQRQFGGIGAMIEKPGLVVQVSHAEHFEIIHDREDRVRSIVDAWVDSLGRSELPRFKIEVVSAPPLHTGLGVGTQLALAVASALETLCDFEDIAVEELASRVGRGLRSAVGTYGFRDGGLIAELGKLPTEDIAPLHDRVSIPRDWRFVLINPQHGGGLSGTPERKAFAKLPPVDPAITAELKHHLNGQLLPAARDADFDQFSEGLYNYGHLAGMCFEKIQGGPYNGERSTKLVESIRELGVMGVGQSSWGPTIFAVCEDDAQALHLRNELLDGNHAEPTEVLIAPPNNCGAKIELHESFSP